MSEFSNSEDIDEAIHDFRRRKERLGNMVIAFLAVLAAIVGVALLVVWSGGSGLSLPFLNTETPTPSLTFTPSITPSLTLSPTIETPSLTPTRSEAVPYIVQAGDTLSSIAEQFGVSVKAIIDYNNTNNNPISPLGIIYETQEILIPPPGWTVSPTPFPVDLSPGTRIPITVEPGDSIQSIANRCFSTIDSILKDKDNIKNYPAMIKDPNMIQVGWTLWCNYGIATPVPDRASPTYGPTPTSTVTPTVGPTSTRAS